MTDRHRSPWWASRRRSILERTPSAPCVKAPTSAEQSVQIAEGDARTARLVIPVVEDAEPEPVVDLELHEEPTPTSAPLQADEPEPRPWYRRGWVWTVVGIGLAAIVGGVAVGVRRGGGGQTNCDELALGCVTP